MWNVALRFRLALLPLVGLVGLLFTLQQVASLPLPREAWAWLIVAFEALLIAIILVQERRALDRKDAEIAALQKPPTAPLLTVLDTGYMKKMREQSMLDSGQRAAEKRADVKEARAALQQEYVLSHDGISPAVLAGTQPPPEEWMRARIEQLNWQRLFPEYFPRRSRVAAPPGPISPR